MPTEFADSEEVHFVGLYTGVVVDNKDPEGLGRVRLRIPGLLEPTSNWAFPIGTLGGGSAQRGFYSPPDIEADVAVLFLQGDVDAPYYFAGHWGKPDAGPETPGPAQGLTGEEATQVKAFETARYQMVWDERPGQEVFRVLDKETGDFVEMDATDGITLKSAVKAVVVAPKVFLGGDNLDENPVSGEGVVLASAVDTFSGQTHGALGGVSTRVFAKKG